ncbi:hypothetical protein Tco_0973815 [Tanacetum coccineum]|uniref:Uncharacterized protein n=1 Tax=Tanacetum coccineum TaxID=301880 RepID=A0ABQ5E9S7_9ASTR
MISFQFSPGNVMIDFNVESSLIESVLNRDNVISSPKIDFLLEEFAGELALIAPIPPGIVETVQLNTEISRIICQIMNDIFDNPIREPRVHVPNVLPTHPTFQLDSDFTLSSDSLGSDLVVYFPSGTRNKIFDPWIFIEDGITRFHANHFPRSDRKVRRKGEEGGKEAGEVKGRGKKKANFFTAVVAPLAGVLDLDIYTTSETDPFEDPSFPAHALVAPITSPFLFTSSDSSESSRDFSDSDSSDSLPPPDPHETVVARWRSKVAVRSSPSTSTLPPTPVKTTISPLALCQIVPAPPRLPRRPAILGLPGQEIPIGRPYCTHPDGVRMLLTARKRVHPFRARIPVNHMRFHSSPSSPPRKRRRASPCTSSSATHSSSPVSTGPSLKGCRSPTIDSPIIRADLLPPRKRLRDPSSTYCHEVSVEVSTEMDIKDSIKAWAEGDIERDTEDSHESDTESDIDSDILVDIEADIAAEDATAVTADTATDAVAAVEGVGDDQAEDVAESSVRGTVEIRIDVVTEPEVPDDIPVSRETFNIGMDVVIQQLYDHMVEFPAQRIVDIEEEGVTLDFEMRLELREMTASVERHLGYMSEELRRIRMAYQYDREDFIRLKTFVMRRLGYRP